MRFLFSLTALASIASTANAVVHQVAVGETGLAYNPNTTTAAVGDTVVFTFYPRSHNVVQGLYTSPCMDTGVTDGIYSGFVPVTSGVANRTFSVTINNTNPIWFYCSQTGGSHCTSGMVGVINPPTTGNETLAAYALAASKVNSSLYTQPANIQGGVFLSAESSTATNGTTANGASNSTGITSPTTTEAGSSSSTGTVMSPSVTSSKPAAASATKNAAAAVTQWSMGTGLMAGGLAFALL